MSSKILEKCDTEDAASRIPGFLPSQAEFAPFVGRYAACLAELMRSHRSIQDRPCCISPGQAAPQMCRRRTQPLLGLVRPPARREVQARPTAPPVCARGQHYDLGVRCTCDPPCATDMHEEYTPSPFQQSDGRSTQHSITEMVTEASDLFRDDDALMKCV